MFYGLYKTERLYVLNRPGKIFIAEDRSTNRFEPESVTYLLLSVSDIDLLDKYITLLINPLKSNLALRRRTRQAVSIRQSAAPHDPPVISCCAYQTR